MGANNTEFQIGKQHLIAPPGEVSDWEPIMKEASEVYPFGKHQKQLLDISQISSVQRYVHDAQVEAMSKAHAMELPPVHVYKNEQRTTWNLVLE